MTGIRLSRAGQFISRSAIGLARPIAEPAALTEYYAFVDRQQTGIDPDRAGPVTSPVVQWTSAESDPMHGRGCPIGATGDIIWKTDLGAAHDVTRFNSETGAEVWNNDTAFNIDNDFIRVDDTIVALDQDGGAQAFDISDGSTLWSVGIGADIEGYPVSDGSSVFFHESVGGGGVRALDLADGSDVWHHQPGDMDETFFSINALAFSNGRVLAPSFDDAANESRVVAMDATDGTELWQSPRIVSRMAGVSVRNGRVVVGRDAGDLANPHVFIYDEADGSEIRRFQISSRIVSNVLIDDSDVGYLVTAGGEAEAYDLTDGSQIFSVVYGDFNRNGYIDSEGQWIVADTGTNTIRALNPADGSEIWESGPIGDNIAPGVATPVDGRLVMGTDDTASTGGFVKGMYP